MHAGNLPAHEWSPDKPGPDDSSYGYTTAGWYFCDETEAHVVGPFASFEEAERARGVVAVVDSRLPVDDDGDGPGSWGGGGRCNFCTLRILQLGVNRRGLVLTQQEGTRDEYSDLLPTGVNVFIHPPGVELDPDKHFAAWFMALPDHCEC